MHQYAGIYLLQIFSKCFGCPSQPSSGILVHESVTAASGTGHIMCSAVQQPSSNVAYRPCWRKVVALLRNMTCTRGRSCSFMYSCLWVRWTPETCRVYLQ